MAQVKMPGPLALRSCAGGSGSRVQNVAKLKAVGVGGVCVCVCMGGQIKQEACMVSMASGVLADVYGLLGNLAMRGRGVTRREATLPRVRAWCKAVASHDGAGEHNVKEQAVMTRRGWHCWLG